MNFTIDYSTRARIRTVAETSPFDLISVSTAATRLRSWAMIRGVTVAGSPFLRITGATDCVVHLPILDEAMPHPETGIQLDAVAAGEVIRVPEVRFGEIRAVGQTLHGLVAETGTETFSEFHSVDGDFLTGDLVLCLKSPAKARPATLTVEGVPDIDSAEQTAAAVRVITIARQHGTAGEAVAQSVARELGLRLVDYEVFGRAAEQAGVSPENIEQAAVHVGLFNRVLDGFSRMGGSYPEPWIAPVSIRATPLFTSAEYRAFVEGAIRELAEQGGVVILGHGAQLVLAKRSDALRVLITGSVEKRVSRAIASGLAPGEAEDVIREADKERLDYFREFYDRGWLDPSTYDLVINTDRITVDDAVDTIINVVARRFPGRQVRVATSAAPSDELVGIGSA